MERITCFEMEKVKKTLPVLSLSFFAFFIPVSHSLINFPLLLFLFTLLLYPEFFKKMVFSPFTFIVLFFLWTGFIFLINEGSLYELFVKKKWFSFLSFSPYFLSYFNFSEKIRKITIQLLFSTAFLVVVLGCIQLLTGIRYPLYRQPIYESLFLGFFTHHNQSGIFYLALLLCSLSYFFSSGRWWYLLFSSGFFLGVVMSGSRSAYVSLFFTSFVFLFLSFGKRALKWGWVILTLFVFSIIIFPFSRERIKALSKENYSVSFRLYQWRMGIMMLKKYPFTGVGYRYTGERLMKEFIPEFVNKNTPWKFSFPPVSVENPLFTHLHNGYLTVAVEGGIPGLLLYMAFWIGSLLSLSRENRWLYTGAFSSILACLIGDLFDYNLRTSHFIIFTTFLIGFFSSRYLESGVKSEFKRF